MGDVISESLVIGDDPIAMREMTSSILRDL